jgi:1-acyl-sn-glycerol-3-phosphate acyltransferase
VKLRLRLKRIGGTASAALEMAGRLAFLRALEDGPDLRSRATVLQQISRALLRIHGIEVEERGMRPAGPALLVSNHVSYLDPVVVMASHPALPVAKDEVRRWPVIGWLCAGAGVQFVARARASSGAAVLRTMARTLQDGVSILNFPEGTTTSGRDVLPLKPGCFGIARAAGAPVVPVAIAWESESLSWTGDASFVPHYLQVAARQRIAVRLQWGDPLDASRAATDRQRELARRAHDFLSRAVQETWDAAAKCA